MKKEDLDLVRIEFAASEGVEQLRSIAEDFMRTIFGFEPADYTITDESQLTDLSHSALGAEILAVKVMKAYGLDVVPNNLLKLFRLLAERRTIQ